MIDSYDTIKKVENIHKESNLLKGIKNKKQEFLYIYLPNIFLIIIPIVLLCSIIFKRNEIIIFIGIIFEVVSLICMCYGEKHYIKINNGKFIKDDDVQFYNRFKEKITEKYSKNDLISIKDILEIETKKEASSNLFSYYFNFFYIILLPIILIILEKKININLLFHITIVGLLVTTMVHLLKTFLNRKIRNKKSILKKIERIIIEIGDKK
jgi:predicted ester cyclase